MFLPVSHVPYRASSTAVLLALVMAYSMSVRAEASGHQADAQHIEELIVWGRAEAQQGRALSASEGLVGYADFSTRPLQRVGELVEVVPGMVATQHSGEGKANQYYLRGMNLDHGTDFSAFFEGMPINLRSHAHGQGYLDLNFLIPEVVATVRYGKGPYAADRGDFSTAGTTSFALYNSLDHPFVEVTGGTDDYQRLVSAGSMDLAHGHLLSAVEIVRNDGPWDNPADVEKENLLLKYSGHWGELDTRVVFSYYENEWLAADQVPARLVDAGVLDRFGFIDSTVGGESSRVSLTGAVESERLHAGLYASRYDLDLFGNFTYFQEDPLNGDQFLQRDRRWIYGGHAHYTLPLSDRVDWRTGVDFRYDDVADTDLYLTTARRVRETPRDDAVDWLSLGGFTELKIQISDVWRSTLGLRYDYNDFEVDARQAPNSGDDSEGNWSASFGLAYFVGEHLEVYANWGQGFHTNDVRGVLIAVNPDGSPATSVDLFVEQTGAEVGVRLEGWQGLNATLTYFWLESDSELLFLGDSGTTEPGDGSRRTGIEFNTFWNINERWTADLNASFVDSEFTDVPSGFDHIPNAHGRVIGAGITYVDPRGLTASIRGRHFGEAPLVEDDSVQHGSTTVFNAAVSYDFGTWELGLEVHNLFDAEDDDIAYFFSSQLPGETAPVDDVHFHPVLPFGVRASVRWELGGR